MQELIAVTHSDDRGRFNLVKWTVKGQSYRVYRTENGVITLEPAVEN